MNLPCPALVGLPATVSARDVLADLDREVLELVRRGEVIAALRRILQCHGRGVFRFCREALRDPALAEDVHQQVFLAAFRALPRFQARSPVRSWLFAIARHRVLDAVRVRNRTRARIQDCETGDVPDPRPLQGEALDVRRLREALAISLGELDDQVRTAILLRYQQGFTFEEMAEICGEKPGTLAARVARAMPRLRARIEAILGEVP